jgi:hypothetical protein
MAAGCGACSSGAGCCKNKPSSSAPSAETSVLLPRRKSQPASYGAAEPIWSITNPTPRVERQRQIEGIMSAEDPLDAKCGADERLGGQCCKDLKGEDERHLISPEIVRDM